jgi:CRISPR/Cas system CSM-associated protein Csm2 small subunit
MKKPKYDSDFGERLVKSLLTAFSEAYQAHYNGATETEIMIQHDIFAAASDYHETIKDGHRKAIHSAIAAVDEHVPYPVARAYLESQLRQRLSEILDEINDN